MNDQDPQLTDPEARTRLAEDRTILANERTYSAWVRTGLAALAAGVAFERLLSGTMPDWILHTISVILIVFSFCAFFLAVWHYTHLGLSVQRAEIHRLPVKSLAALTAALCVASVLALVGIFLG